MTIGTWALQINGGHKDAAPPLGRWCHHLMSQSAVLHQNSNCGAATIDNYFIIYPPQPSPGPRHCDQCENCPIPPLSFKSDSNIIFMQINIQSMTFVCFIIVSFIANWPHSSVKYCGQQLAATLSISHFFNQCSGKWTNLINLSPLLWRWLKITSGPKGWLVIAKNPSNALHS